MPATVTHWSACKAGAGNDEALIMTDRIDSLRQVLAGRYDIERELGRGGMAVVYLADDLKHGLKVAIKVVDEPGLATGLDRFQREIAIAARLTHPHVLP